MVGKRGCEDGCVFDRMYSVKKKEEHRVLCVSASVLRGYFPAEKDFEEYIARKEDRVFKTEKQSAFLFYSPDGISDSEKKEIEEASLPEEGSEVVKELADTEKLVSDKEAELEQLGGEEAEEFMKDYIERLHRYNETKDCSQFLLGKLASYRGATVKEMHEEFGVESD
ncbi:MAG: Swi5-like protein [Amphiamblys sp. WSBS2006]|nr:MAG: Swi5-like protein [Amphiamblys sp. WSBS2006]